MVLETSPPLNGNSHKKNPLSFSTFLIITPLPPSQEGIHCLQICFVNKNSKLNHQAYPAQPARGPEGPAR